MSDLTQTTTELSSSEMQEALAMPKQKAAEMPAALIAIEGTFKTTIFELCPGEVTVGRNLQNTISLDYEGVSRRHMKLTVNKDSSSVVLEDLGSTNGTYLNDCLLKKPASLKKGDIIYIGRTAFKFLPKGDPAWLSYNRLRKETFTDGLTRCFNKTYFNNVMEMEVKKSKRTRHPLSLILFDIDYFKQLNDTYGHNAGDYVLESVAEIIRSHGVREYDVFARHGGEEFVVLLPKTSSAQAKKIAERFRKLIEQHNFIYDNRKTQVTISVGVANLRRGVRTGADLFKRADAAMYQSKSKGRNRVTFYKP